MNKQFRFILVFILALGLNNSSVKAQSTFASEEELKKQAALLFDDDQFEEAYPLYSQLVSLYQKDVNYNYRLGVCMLYASDDKEKPIPFLEFAANKPEAEKEALFYLAKSYHLNYRFDDAIKKYNEYKKVASAAKADKLMVDRQIEMCKNGKKLLRKITDLIVLDKKEMSRADFFRSYDISDIGGKLLVKPDEKVFKSSIDKKKKENSIIYLATNNNQVYYSSYGENGDRGKDIYVIKKLPNGEWSAPQTLGYPVNTEYDEDYPFLHPNGKVLYFCSKGHNSMGGYDVFKTTLNEETNTWNKPINMDFPINTPDDDILYVTNENEQEAFFSSARNSVTGKTGVFHINVERKPIDVAIIKGAVASNRQGQALDVRITVKDLGDNSMLGIYNAKETGAYIINLPNGGKFLYTVEATGFKTQSEVVELPVQYEFKPLKQEISYELGTDKLIIKNLFDEAIDDDANYLSAMKYIKERSKLEANSANEIAAAANKTNAIENKTENTTSNQTETANNKNENQPVNISNNDIVKIAFNDAKEVETESKEITEQANIALNIANQKAMLAQNKQNEANQLQEDANKIQDPVKKRQVQEEANEAVLEAEQLNQETVAAFNLAKRLEQKANSKQKEADISLKYANAIEEAVKSKNASEALAKADDLQKQLDALNQENEAKGNITNSLKIDVDNKKYELDKAIETNNDIKQGIADNEVLIKNLKADIEKTKNEKIKADLQNQITGLAEDNEENKKDLVFSEQRVAKLQKEYETVKNEMELVSNVVSQSKTTTNESAANSVASIDKNKLEEQVNTIKNSTPVVATNTNQNNSTSTENKTEAKNNATNTEIINNTNENIAAENKVDYNTNFNEELNKVDAISNEAEKENKKAEIYNNWVSAINKDIADKKQEVKTTKDSKRKKELNTEIAALEKESKTKQKTADESIANAKKLEQESIASNTNNTSTENNSSSETTNETPANFNQKYAEELYTAQGITNEADKEQKRAEILKAWSQAIDKDIAKKKQDMAASNDPEMKALLAQKIIDLKKQSDEKQTQANEAASRADELKQKQAVATNNNEQSTTNNQSTNEQNNQLANKQSNESTNEQPITNNNQTATNNQNTNNEQAITNNNQPTTNNQQLTTNNEQPTTNLTYAEKFNNSLKSADSKTSELEKEKTKQEAYTNYITSATTELTDKKQELKTTKDKNRKKELPQEIASLENDIAAKQTELTSIETNIETIQEQSTTAENTSNSNKQPENNSQKTVTYNSPTAISAIAKSNELNKQADELFSEAKELENKAAATKNTNEKNKLTEEAAAKTTQAEDKRIESLVTISNGNSSEIETNKNVLNQYAVASKNKNADELTMAEMMKDEALIYFEKSKKSKLAAETESSFYAKETLMQDANDNEKIALEKQNKALELYKKYNQSLDITDNTNTIASNTNSNKQPENNTTNNQQLATNNEQPVTNNNQSSSNTSTENNNKQQTTNNEQPIVNNNQNTNNTSSENNNKQQTTNNEQPIANNNQNTNNATTENNNQLATNNEQPTSNNNEQPTTNTNIKSNVELAPEEKFTRTNQSVYTASKPIPVNEKLPEGLVFKVQIGAFRNPIAPETFAGMSPLTAETTPQGLTRYTAGLFTKFSTADKVKNEIRDLGYRDAFVVAFLNGKRIPINQALEMSGLPPIATNNTPTTNNSQQPVTNNEQPTTNNQQPTTNNQQQNVASVGGLFYTVQIGVFSQQVSADKLYNIQPLYTEVAPNGYIRYNTGIYNNIPKATEAKNIVVNAGIKDAFIVVYFNGKRITPAEAEQLIADGKATYSTASNMNVLPTVGGRTNQSINQSTNQPINKSTNQSTTNNQQPNNQSTSQPINQSTNQPTTNNQQPTTNNQQPTALPIEEGVYFRVQIGAFKDEVPLDIANKFLRIAKKGIKNYKNESGLTVYSVGSYKTYDAAAAAKAEVVAEGVVDAFIVAYKDGTKITVEEAKELLNK